MCVLESKSLLIISYKKESDLNITFLADRDYWRQIIDDECNSWIKENLKNLDLDLDIVYGKDKHKSVRYLIENDLAIEYSQRDYSVHIFRKNTNLAWWKVVSIQLKRDKDGSFYNEIVVDAESVIAKQGKVKEKNKK